MCLGEFGIGGLTKAVFDYRKIGQKRTASVIYYVRVYSVGQASTSAKQRRGVTYLEVTSNASQLVPT